MERWKYYLLDDGAGAPYEIYRLRDSGNSFHREHPSGLFRALECGDWSNATEDIRGLLNASLCGDFVPDDSEITEEQAMAYLDQWRRVGPWPGRP
jgi:hypothetical protein